VTARIYRWIALFVLCAALVASLAARLPRWLSLNAGLVYLTHAMVEDATWSQPVRDQNALARAEGWLRKATAYAPESRSAWRGFGFALAAQGREAEAVAAWQRAGLTAQEFVNAGEEAWKAGRYAEVLAWHGWASMLNKQQSPSARFRSAIAAIIVGRALPQPLDPAVLVIHPLTDSVEIEAETLQWTHADPYWGLDYGDRLIDLPSPDPTVGVMWWAGAAVAVVQVQHEATYQITVRAKHSTPDPGQLQVEHNLSPIALFSLTQTWQEFKTTVNLSSGPHIIGVRYMQNNGDAILDWIRLRR
jgi:tetratricopeptide (TPR) repeat protein